MREKGRERKRTKKEGKCWHEEKEKNGEERKKKEKEKKGKETGQRPEKVVKT